MNGFLYIFAVIGIITTAIADSLGVAVTLSMTRFTYTEYRAFSSGLLEMLPLSANSDDFVFDNQILAETIWLGQAIGEVSCPTSYAPEASSINFRRSVRYGFGCLSTAFAFRLAKLGLLRSVRFPKTL